MKDGFILGVTFFAAYAAGKFKSRKTRREMRRSRNLWAVERFMLVECDMLLWGIRP